MQTIVLNCDLYDSYDLYDEDDEDDEDKNYMHLTNYPTIRYFCKSICLKL